jgi:hypothetical protein
MLVQLINYLEEIITDTASSRSVKKLNISQAWGCTPVIPKFGRLRQEWCKF